MRRRGLAYQRAGNVRLQRGEPGEILALVSGTVDYAVSLGVDRACNVDDFSCTCPYVTDDRVCKHVWATAVAVDELILQMGMEAHLVLDTMGAAPAGHKPAEHDLVRPDDDDLDDDDLDDDDPDGDDPDGDDLSGRGVHNVGAPRSVSTQPWSQYRHAEHERRRWQQLLGAVEHPATQQLGNPAAQTWYLLDIYRDSRSGYYWRDRGISLHAARRTRRKDGQLAKPTAVGKPPDGARPPGVEGVVWALARNGAAGTAVLGGELAIDALSDLCAKGRLGAVAGLHSKDVAALRWDADRRFRAVLYATELPRGESFRVSVVLRRPRVANEAPTLPSRREPVEPAQMEREPAEPTFEELPLSALDATLEFDLLVSGDRLLRLAPNHVQWVEGLLREPLALNHEGLQELTTALARTGGAPSIEGDGVPQAERVRQPLRPLLRLSLPARAAKLVRGTLSFRYGAVEVGYKVDNFELDGALVSRDLEAETAAVTHLQELGLTVEVSPTTHHVRSFEVKFDASDFSEIAPSLLDADFVVELEGKPYRRAGAFSPIIESGQDWFQLQATVDFEGELVQLPELLRAIRKREQWIRLRDGSLGMIPNSWFESLSELAEFVSPRAKTLRFHPIAAQLVEGVLHGAADLQSDAGFAAMKRTLATFEQIKPLKKPRGFVGDLRDYQSLALGWLYALDSLGFGGCLADDMGLGKTVVVLAWLMQRRNAARSARRRGTKTLNAGEPRPSLLVVPKSLLFNWQRECARFTPELRMLLHHGVDRRAVGAHFADYDIILTSYGTLRRDAETLAQQQFDYVVLDEAHGIKNAGTESHKAARALSSRRRLALTGTPVENHLGELWNLLTYLNPNVMQSMAHLQKIFEGRRLTKSSIEAGVLRFIQPFILRRTKAEVAKDLPERIEKTLEVQLSPSERKLYDELALYYRRRMSESRAINKRYKQLGAGAAGSGQAGRQMADALEGLLRLRQAACHPGLLDDKRIAQSSSKFDVLLEQLLALRAEGHKALVFSQFTRLLGLLKPHLEQAGIGYAYLDGKTRDRAAVVDTFSNDPESSVFLISLKAGGVGLNLVAADYVFLLDPWWNPASEAQAIDRAHRIGQQRTVIAYRLLSSDTVEGKVAALQDEKRELALSLFGDEATFSAKFTREDLEQLLA